MYNLVINEHQSTDHLHSVTDISLGCKGHPSWTLQKSVRNVTGLVGCEEKMDEEHPALCRDNCHDQSVFGQVTLGNWNPSSAAGDHRVKPHQPLSCPWKPFTSAWGELHSSLSTSEPSWEQNNLRCQILFLYSRTITTHTEQFQTLQKPFWVSTECLCIFSPRRCARSSWTDFSKVPFSFRSARWQHVFHVVDVSEWLLSSLDVDPKPVLTPVDLFL